MSNEELSNGFDILLDNYSRSSLFGEDTSRADIRVDEYEKSLYLTITQKEYVQSLYNGLNATGTGFEETEEARRALANLIKEATLDPLDDTKIEEAKLTGIEPEKSYFFELPTGETVEDNPAVWFITYESAESSTKNKCGKAINLEVRPVKQDEYQRLRNNPFRGLSKNKALRLDISDNYVELVSELPIEKYYIRYIKKLKPIILMNLPDGLTIEGESDSTSCELDDSLHQRILELAVLKAIQSKQLTAQPNTSKENK